MKKSSNKCRECSQRKGKRACLLHNNQSICPSCCAKIRNSQCRGCIYYKEAQHYASSKIMRSKARDFIIPLNPEIDDAVDDVLVLLEKGEIEKSELMLSQLMEKHPHYHTIYYGIGLIHAFKKQYDEAIEYFDKAIDIFPYFIEAHFNKAVAYKNNLDIGNAIKAFREVTSIGDPTDETVMQAQFFLDSAQKHLKGSDGIDLDIYLEAEKQFNEAFSYMEKGQWQKALDGFKAHSHKIKNHVQTYGNMGICYAYLGDKTRALAALDKALEIDPNYEPAIVNRTMVESMKEDESLSHSNFESIEYYKDYAVEKKSLIKSTIKRIFNRG